jgi:hypothetical protein
MRRGERDLGKLTRWTDANESAVIEHILVVVQELDRNGRCFNIAKKVESYLANKPFVKHIAEAIRTGTWESERVQIDDRLAQEERAGWELTEACNMMKDGERDIVKLTDNVDPMSGAVVEHILRLVLASPSDTTSVDEFSGVGSDNAVSEVVESDDEGDGPTAGTMPSFHEFMSQMMQDPQTLQRIQQAIGGRGRNPTVVKERCGPFKAGDRVKVVEQNPRYGLGSIVPHRSVGTIRGFDEDNDVIIDFECKRGWVGHLSEIEIWGDSTPIIEEIDDEVQEIPAAKAPEAPKEPEQAAETQHQQEGSMIARTFSDMTADFPKSFFCPITHQVMKEPVLAMDGHTYEKEAISKWVSKHGTSPMTNMPLPSPQLFPNHCVRAAIAEALGSKV